MACVIGSNGVLTDSRTPDGWQQGTTKPQRAISALSLSSPLDCGANSLSTQPSGMHVGPAGNLWVLDPPNARFLIFDRKDYSLIKTWGERGSKKGQLNNPLKFAFSKDGTKVFVADHYNYRVQVFDLDGNYLFHFGSKDSDSGKLFVLPFGITAGVDGYVYVTDVGSHQVFKFSEDGKLVKNWGRWGSGPGQFYKPKGISQHQDGQLFVADFGNHRAQVFSSNGDFVTEFGINEAMQPRNEVNMSKGQAQLSGPSSLVGDLTPVE